LNSVLSIKNLHKIYRRSHLGRVHTTVGLKNLNLEVAPAEILGLIGPNGAGKTTAIKLILGLLNPTQGEIFLFGKKLPDPALIQRVGFLPEVPYFPRNFSVQEVLFFYGKLSGIPSSKIKERMAQVLDTVRMTHRKDKRVKECSKGMLQRLSLAQALIHDPDILIFDEPITGLDPVGLTEMREMILSLNKAGKTIVFSSHIISEVERIAHKAVIMAGGEIVKELSVNDWKAKPGLLEEIFVQAIHERGRADE
jgi:ABC-2 type transport system ATP-binding protein